MSDSGLLLCQAFLEPHKLISVPGHQLMMWPCTYTGIRCRSRSGHGQDCIEKGVCVNKYLAPYHNLRAKIHCNEFALTFSTPWPHGMGPTQLDGLFRMRTPTDVCIDSFRNTVIDEVVCKS